MRGLLTGLLLAAAVLAVGRPLFGDSEARLLAWVSAALVILLAMLAAGDDHRRGARWTAALLALAAAMALWVIPPHTATRAVMVGAVWVAALVIMAVQRGTGHRDDFGLAQLNTGHLSTGSWVALALGVQLLMRPQLWLEPLSSPRTWIAWLGLPAAAGVALCWLAVAHGTRRALLAGLAVVVVTPGFRVGGTLTLVALAAAWVAFDRDRGMALRMTAAAVLAAPVLWEPRTGLWIVAAGLVIAAPARWAVVVGIMATGSALAPWAARDWTATARLLVWLPLVLPLLALPPAMQSDPGRRQRWWIALVLAVAAARWLPVPGGVGAGAVAGAATGALAPAVALVALTLRRRGSDDDGGASAAVQAQTAWSAVLFAGTALLATYPWLRIEPLADLLGVLGVAPGRQTALAALAITLLVLLLGRLAPDGREPSSADRDRGLLLGHPATAVLAAALLAAWLALPAPGERLAIGPGVVFSAEEPAQAVALSRPLSGMVFESYLVNAAALPAGTPVATITLTDAGGVEHRYTVTAGRDTGEWAARRLDVAQLGVQLGSRSQPGGSPGTNTGTTTGTNTAPPWRSRLDAGGSFFTQSYRSRWRLTPAVAAARLAVARDEHLPVEVSWVMTWLELTP